MDEAAGLPWVRDVTRVLAIDGPSGSGKSTYADLVAAELTRRTGHAPPVVHMDDIYPGWDGLSQAVNLVTDLVLKPLATGGTSGFRQWDWNAGMRAEWVPVPPAEWVVVEGVGCGSRRCRPFLAGLVWVDADKDVRMARGIERDGQSFAPHWERWALQEEALFAAEHTRDHADLVIRT